jgi:hypothetical protein
LNIDPSYEEENNVNLNVVPSYEGEKGTTYWVDECVSSI